MKNAPQRCIDPVMKYCQGCRYGHIIYPDWVETYQDTLDCTFKTICILGYDRGRPEDEPTPEEMQEFDEWVRRVYE